MDGNSTKWTVVLGACDRGWEPLSPSVFSLQSFVCGLSETFQESDSQLHVAKECQKQECLLSSSLKLYYFINAHCSMSNIHRFEINTVEKCRINSEGLRTLQFI